MKKVFYAVLMTALVSLTACHKDLWNAIDGLDVRVTKLEELCKEMNTNISSLQTIVNVIQTNDFITSITEIKKGNDVIGYTITFGQHNPITIYNGVDGKDGQNGTNGKDGHTPIISVAQDTDGVYYWKLDGEWLLDDNGQKIRVTGKDGKNGENGKDGKDGVDGKDGQDGQNGQDGITPQLKIENDYWYISYNNGATWTQLGKATGADGKDGQDGKNGKDGKDGADGQDGADGDSMFKSVTQDENYVYFTLADGSVIKVNKLGSDIDQIVIDNLVNSISLDKTTIYAVVGDQIQITSTTKPFATSKVTWSSLNEDVVSVEDGKITALQAGVSRITAYAGDKSTTCLVYVKDIDPVFSVSATKKVQFAWGNLMIENEQYKFADYFQNGDLFLWGEKSGLKNGSFDNSTYSEYYYDWGIHPITNAGNVANEWRTLDSTEWKYLLNERANANELKFTYKNAWILLPDNIEDKLSCTVEKCISEAIWKEFLIYVGAVYLPATGYEIIRGGTKYAGCFYWTSQAKYRDYNYPTTGIMIDISTGTTLAHYQSGKTIRTTYGAVRLVKDVK